MFKIGQTKKSSYAIFMAGRILSFVIALVLFFGFFYLFAGKLFFSDKSAEYTRRIACREKLRQIAKALESDKLKLEKDNITTIENVITKLNLRCSSGLIAHTDKSKALYSLFRLPDGHIVISENADNHDPHILKNINCGYVRYCLYESQYDSNRIELGVWRDPNMVFDTIQPVTESLE